VTQNHHELVIDNVRERLSNLSAVQTMLGAGDASAALAKIYFGSAEGDGTEDPPLIVVRWGTQTITFNTGDLGQLPVWITFQWLVPVVNSGTYSERARWASGQWQTIVNELRTGLHGITQTTEAQADLLEVPRDEVPNHIAGDRYVWEAFLQLDIDT